MENPNYASLDKPFPCLICGKLLESTGEDGRAELVVRQNYGVYGGIDFKTTGGYGSRILDMNGPIYFVICDICILQRRHRILGKKMNSGAGRVGGEHLDVEIQNGVGMLNLAVHIQNL